MDDPPLQKVAISGPTLASMTQRFSSSPGPFDGLLFGHVTHITPATVSDDSPTSTQSESCTLLATITNFLCFGKTHSFYNSTGRVDSAVLRRLLAASEQIQINRFFIGWFSGRRKSHIRPSLREFSVAASISSDAHFSFPIRNAISPSNLTPCIFLLLASPLQDITVHTHEYRAYQFRNSTQSLEPKSIEIVNIGPEFRGHYGSFIPNSSFPFLSCELGASPMMIEDEKEESLRKLKQVTKDQKQLDMCTEGLQVESLNRLIGTEAVSYTAGLEDWYTKMIAKIETLKRLVEKSSAKVLEQEAHNRKLRYRVARSAGSD